MIAKMIAKLMLGQIMLEASRDKTEETIKLTKKPGKEGTSDLKVKVSFKCAKDRIPLYCEKIVKSAAISTGVSFEEMLTHLKTTHELVGEISEEITKKEARDEDKQA